MEDALPKIAEKETNECSLQECREVIMDFKLQKFACLLCIAATYIFLSFTNCQILKGLLYKSNMGSLPAQEQAEWTMR